jgi:zinc transport system substrate-binding protein
MAFLIELVKAENIPCVYYVELSNQSTANTIAEATGCQTALLHSCERPTLAQFNDGVTYASLMRDNVISLVKGVV